MSTIRGGQAKYDEVYIEEYFAPDNEEVCHLHEFYIISRETSSI
jgi:hypothetical protein